MPWLLGHFRASDEARWYLRYLGVRLITTRQSRLWYSYAILSIVFAVVIVIIARGAVRILLTLALLGQAGIAVSRARGG